MYCLQVVEVRSPSSKCQGVCSFWGEWGRICSRTSHGKCPLSITQSQSGQAGLPWPSDCTPCAPRVCRWLWDLRIERHRVFTLRHWEALSGVHGTGRRSSYRTSHQPPKWIRKSKRNNISWAKCRVQMGIVTRDDSVGLARYWARFVVRTFNQVAWKIY